MSGGEAYVLDESGQFRNLCNTDMVDLEPVADDKDRAALRRMIEDHLRYTDSSIAQRVLDNWDDMLPRFVKVMPIDYKRALIERPEIEQPVPVAG
jgi:glutamate synthase domain-containing protein 3